MKAKPILQTLVMLAAMTFTASAQTGGDLTPLGAPGKTMKSLDQMEPRTPLIDGAPGVSIAASGTITISQSGSYYLANNLSVTGGDGITINANAVTFDLRGFTITSSAATSSSYGIDINGSDITIYNGHIVSGTTYDSEAEGDQFTGPGFDYGVYASSAYSIIHIDNLSVSGCGFYGIYFSSLDDTLVESCTVRTTGSYGIRAGIVRDCAATECGSNAIWTKTAHNSRGISTGGEGINATNVSNCYGSSDSSDGIWATTVSNCYGYTNGASTVADGIDASATVLNSYGISDNVAGGDGIEALNVNNCYGKSDGIHGISARIVSNSYGFTYGASTSADGIEADTVMNCYGWSNNAAGGDGINAEIASFSYGLSNGTGGSSEGIQAQRAIGCYAVGGENIGVKYLMP